MSLFRIVKYSSVLFFLGKHKAKLFRAIGVLLFAGLTSLLYQDVSDYLEIRHPGLLIYALLGKIAIVYGAFAVVLWQFRPKKPASEKHSEIGSLEPKNREGNKPAATDALSALEDVSTKDQLQSRYEGVLKKSEIAGKNK